MIKNILFLLLSASLYSTEKPNIIFILADDLGWAELGCYGNKFNETMYLDKMAEEGLRFTHAYAAAPVCSPYRASFLTGQFPARVGITDYLRPNDKPLTEEYITLPEILKENGYITGMIGKWHLTGYRYHGSKIQTRPKHHRIDEEIISEIKGVGNGANFYPYKFRNQPISFLQVKEKKLPGNEYLTDRLNHEAVEFVKRHKDRPFFLYLSHYAPHSILNGRPDLVEKYRGKHPPGKSTRSKCYLCQDAGLKGDAGNHWAGDHNPHLAAMLHSIDDGVRQITEVLEGLGLKKNTILVFTSDNGGEAPNVTSNAPLRGGKSQLYEGGIRVPLIVRWPKVIKAGQVTSQSTVSMDYYPTFIEAAGIKADKRQLLDGESILPLFENPDQEMKKRPYFWHYPLEKPHFLGGVSAGAVRYGNWKLIESFSEQSYELFNLTEDPYEKVNLVEDNPENFKKMLELLSDWRREIGVE
ncbi:MAG: sulfatase [Lentisphaerales bacterium]|nr:sulfatase [Lentisphaerales bacterium]